MKNKKVIIITVGIMIALAIICTASYFIISNMNNNNQPQNLVKVQEDGSKISINPKLEKARQVDGLEITNLALTENGNVTKLTGTITNKSAQEKGDYLIKITFLDKQGNVMTTIEPYVKKLQPGESTNLNASTTFDYTNAYDIQISK